MDLPRLHRRLQLLSLPQAPWICTHRVGVQVFRRCCTPAYVPWRSVINLKEVDASSVRELLARDPKAKGKNGGTTPEKKPPKEVKPKAVTNGAGPTKKRKKTVKPPRPTDGNVSDASSDLSSVPSSDLSSVPLTTSEDTSLVSKKPIRRSPKTVLAPKLVINLATGGLTSAQIMLRLNVREFIIRFRHLLPAIGKVSSNKVEAERSVEAMMDDVVGFWEEDEGGMRALVLGLIGLIEKEEAKHPGLVLLEAPETSLALLPAIKRELKTGVTGAHHTQGATQCWESALPLRCLHSSYGFGLTLC